MKCMEEISQDTRNFTELYDTVVDILSTYIDVSDDDKRIIALWTIACGFKDKFITFPFLFFNASKGSGKTRMLKLLEALIPRAKLTPNLTEASLIRLPSQEILNALLIDEAERMTSKEKSTLRELLNQAYKKGGKILRVEEDKQGNRFVREYPVFLGIALANIWGLEPVLEDRCITIILSKSNNPTITKIPEFFHLDERIERVKNTILVYEVHVCTLLEVVCMYYFNYIIYDTLLTLYTQQQLPTLPTLDIIEQEKMSFDIEIFCDHIKNSSLMGRDLELWFPLLTISSLISEPFFLDTLDLAEKRCKEKKELDIIEDRDVIFLTFLYNFLKTENIAEGEMVSARTLRDSFLNIEGQKDWLTSEWIGRCLRRSNVIKNKRRLAKGLEYEISIERLEEYLVRRGIALSDLLQKAELNEVQSDLKQVPSKEDREEADKKFIEEMVDHE